MGSINSNSKNLKGTKPSFPELARARGVVVHGNEIGRTIGFPTANVELDSPLSLDFAVYIAKFIIDGEEYVSIANYGSRPTVEKSVKPVLECHILDFNRDIYSKWAEVVFYKKIRDITKFDSLASLKEQLEKDKREAIEWGALNWLFKLKK